jgi:DNA-binding transcriptional regulator YdaS (Cro superfamily)
MKFSDYIQSKPIGEIRRLANAIGAFEPDVSRWVSGKRPVPIWRCAAIEKFTCGDVSRKDLRPDDWHRIWPELQEAA